MRKALGLLFLLCCAGAMIAPASARSLHQLEHARTIVADGEHHHHEGSAVVLDADSASIDIDIDIESKGKKLPEQTGHTHLPSPSADLAFAGIENLRSSAPTSGCAPSAADTPALPTLSWLPLIRPPIAA